VKRFTLTVDVRIAGEMSNLPWNYKQHSDVHGMYAPLLRRGIETIRVPSKAHGSIAVPCEALFEVLKRIDTIYC
jgi:hypothetical protein